MRDIPRSWGKGQTARTQHSLGGITTLNIDDNIGQRLRIKHYTYGSHLRRSFTQGTTNGTQAKCGNFIVQNIDAVIGGRSRVTIIRGPGVQLNSKSFKMIPVGDEVIDSGNGACLHHIPIRWGEGDCRWGDNNLCGIGGG